MPSKKPGRLERRAMVGESWQSMHVTGCVTTQWRSVKVWSSSMRAWARSSRKSIEKA